MSGACEMNIMMEGQEMMLSSSMRAEGGVGPGVLQEHEEPDPYIIVILSQL